MARKVAEMARLALAVREAEGAERLPEAMLRDLPTNGDAAPGPAAGRAPGRGRQAHSVPPERTAKLPR
ncbi:hypothetical protein [Streptomyces rapamycinicus]|uniref:Uncharacterized protein n=2 Tax=Streptomyces rapamycinicus TaxID=1226757 RepID=A0A3L8R299_STRRN|nr:hypothetical protein [Streptomyces rapamycinicus]MBB4781595.1 hypothetical protein [Streptomyces rapamycinicus]RLV73764.1 hypothetical protein D3C57_131100 [Streptomyces rapamycinicus NRRL 5491]